MTTSVKKSEITAVRDHFANGGHYSNMNCQYVKRADGVMLRYDAESGDYKFFNDEDKFFRAVVRFTKRGF